MSDGYRFRGWFPVCCVTAICLSAGVSARSAEEPPGARPDGGAAGIAPLLARRCLECHGGADKEGGLDLSRRRSAEAGGESGKAIVPGRADESLVWQLVEADEMPKDREPLSAEEKRTLKKWIDDGAAWAVESIDPFAYSTDLRGGYDWWSLQPVREPSPPSVENDSWPRNDVDRFVLRRLEQERLAPAGEADRRTLIRRLYFDLLGLPPDPEAVERFDADRSSNAYEQLVDRLLDSPHYGERWARHWLDVVRFGETQGFERNRIRENAWRYRDWVIRSMNEDLPYDEFVRLQIAGDVLRPDDYDALMATGYHVCGTWDQVGHVEGSESMRKAARWDHLEDLVGTLGQAFLGLTLNCGRCHDHKFDPISQQEYYQVASLLGGVTQQQDERDVQATRDRRLEAECRERLERVRGELSRFEADLRQRYGRDSGGERAVVEGLEALYVFDDSGSESPEVIEDTSGGRNAVPLGSGRPPRYSTKTAPRELIQAVQKSGELTVEAWITPADKSQSGPARIVTISKDSALRNFTLGHDGDRFDMRLRTTKTDNNGTPSLTTPSGAVEAERKTHVVCTFDRDGVGRIYVDGRATCRRDFGGDLSNWDDGFALAVGDELTGDRTWRGHHHLVAVYSRALTSDEVRRGFDTQSRDARSGDSFPAVLAGATERERARHKDLLARRDELDGRLRELSFDGAAHVVVPRQPEVFHVLARGNPSSPLHEVVPAAPRALSRGGLSGDFGLDKDAPEAERRARLARWLSDTRNPLTARVMVNRLWHHHFGVGIVDTPSDFGFSGGRPSHPELLDYLAHRFMSDGWRIKDLHRLIVNSATYRQRSRVDNDRATGLDADNRLLWRQNRRRLEGEAIRDAVLAVSGALNRQLGGPSFRDMQLSGGMMGSNAEFTEPTDRFDDEVNRRTIYRLWARAGNNPLLQSLDCPDPSVMAPTRTKTITPVQSLSLLNNSLMEQAGKRFARRIEDSVGDSVDNQVEFAYRLAYARPPTEREAELGRRFVADHGLDQYCLVIFNTNEFLYVD